MSTSIRNKVNWRLDCIYLEKPKPFTAPLDWLSLLAWHSLFYGGRVTTGMAVR